LRGILDRTKTPYESIEEFVLPYTKSEEIPESVVDLDNPAPSKGAQLPAVPAVEFLADIRESQGRIAEATEVQAPASLPVD
jgi:protein farnesyltransferase/geranylgeranyltransferase type-1 subunit alpha